MDACYKNKCPTMISLAKKQKQKKKKKKEKPGIISQGGKKLSEGLKFV